MGLGAIQTEGEFGFEVIHGICLQQPRLERFAEGLKLLSFLKRLHCLCSLKEPGPKRKATFRTKTLTLDHGAAENH